MYETGSSSARRPAQERLDAREQLVAVERLRHVVVGPGAQSADVVRLGVAGSEHQHRHLAQVSDPLEDLPAVELGHRHVEDDQIVLAGVERPQRRAPVGLIVDVISRPFEHEPEERPDVLVVVDDEHQLPVRGWIHPNGVTRTSDFDASYGIHTFLQSPFLRVRAKT